MFVHSTKIPRLNPSLDDTNVQNLFKEYADADLNEAVLTQDKNVFISNLLRRLPTKLPGIAANMELLKLAVYVYVKPSLMILILMNIRMRKYQII